MARGPFGVCSSTLTFSLHPLYLRTHLVENLSDVAWVQVALEAEAAALEVGAGLRARNLRDMRRFLNLTEFLSALLPAAGARLFCPWVYIFTIELQVKTPLAQFL